MRRPDLLALTMVLTVLTVLTRPGGGLRRRPGRQGVERDRGDVPGWVMVTIMTAAVVVVLIPFVGPIIAKAFSHAVSSVANTPSSQ